MELELTTRNKFALAMLGSSFVGFLLLILGSLFAHEFKYSYLLYNLALAWIPLLISYRLVVVLRNKSWTSWEALLTTLVWVIFLPNAFYMITDFIHIQDISSSLAIYYAVSFASIIFNAVFLGIVSLFLVHDELLRRLNKTQTNYIVILVLLLCSFAVYLGRDLRWNSWDAFINPGGVLFDFTQKLITPSQYSVIFGISGAMFVFLLSIYILSRITIQYVRGRSY